MLSCSFSFFLSATFDLGFSSCIGTTRDDDWSSVFGYPGLPRMRCQNFLVVVYQTLLNQVGLFFNRVCHRFT